MNFSTKTNNPGLKNLECIFLAAGVFFIPIKLSFSYICFGFGLCFFLTKNHQRKAIIHTLQDPLVKYFLLFLLVGFLSAPFGFRPLESITGLAKLLIFPLLIPAIAVSFQRQQMVLLFTLLLSQVLTSLHTIISLKASLPLAEFLPGAVSESGQLALLIPLAFAILFTVKKLSEDDGRSETLQRTFCAIMIPVLITALVINLKRGPWMGVFAGLLCLFFLVQKRLVLFLIFISLALFALVDPVQHRALEAFDHFFIEGGRHLIWTVGLDLAAEYPLGIGFNNSDFLLDYSSYIPSQLNHFHNNFLNILVETGWIGILVFLFWILHILKTAFSGKFHPEHQTLCLGIGCALLSWQVAGLVEYNFGDSEVWLTALILLGVLYSCQYQQQAPDKSLQSDPLSG